MDVLRVIPGTWFLPARPRWREDVGRMLAHVVDGLPYGARGGAPRQGKLSRKAG